MSYSVSFKVPAVDRSISLFAMTTLHSNVYPRGDFSQALNILQSCVIFYDVFKVMQLFGIEAL